MTIERESSLNFVTKNLYGKKDKIPEIFKLTFWVTTVLNLVLLGFSETYVLIGIYCALDLSFLILPKCLSRRCDYIVGDALKWALIMIMFTLMPFAMYVFGCEYVGEIERSSLLWIIPTELTVSLFALYLGLKKISKTTTLSKKLISATSGGLSIFFYAGIAIFAKKVLKLIPMMITIAVLSGAMLYYLFYLALPLLYAVIKYKFTWDDIDILGNSLK